MVMNGLHLSTLIRSNLATSKLTAPTIVHKNAWDAISSAICSELLIAMHVPNMVCNDSTIVLIPVLSASINANDLTAAIKTAIAVVYSVKPTNAHSLYWNAIATAIITYLKNNLKLQFNVATGSAHPRTYTPSWNIANPGLELSKSIRTYIAAANKTKPTTVHHNAWYAISTAIVAFIRNYYISIPSPGIAAGASSLILSVL